VILISAGRKKQYRWSTYANSILISYRSWSGILPLPRRSIIQCLLPYNGADISSLNRIATNRRANYNPVCSPDFIWKVIINSKVQNSRDNIVPTLGDIIFIYPNDEFAFFSRAWILKQKQSKRYFNLFGKPEFRKRKTLFRAVFLHKIDSQLLRFYLYM